MNSAIFFAACFVLVLKVESTHIHCVLSCHAMSEIRICYKTNSSDESTKNMTIIGERSDKVTSLTFKGYQKYLPIEVHFSYPKIEWYVATACGITEVSKLNFENLSELEFIRLDFNELETVESDTFQGLARLRYISIGNIYFSVNVLIDDFCFSLKYGTKSSF